MSFWSDLLELTPAYENTSTWESALDCLDFSYGTLVVENEIVRGGPAGDRQYTNYGPVEFTPIMAGTMTGSVCFPRPSLVDARHIYGGTIQTFVVRESGVFEFRTVRDGPHVIGANLNLLTGEINFRWDGVPGETYLVVSYERPRD